MNSLATPDTSNYEFRDERGDTLGIKAAAGGGAFMLVPDAILRFPNQQAPAMALAILKAAGFVPRGNRVDSDSFQECVDTAAGYLDDAVLIADGQAAKKELTRRRDELAEKYFRNDYCDLQFPSHRLAIDDMIQLQDEATK